MTFSAGKPYAIITLGAFFDAGRKSQAAIVLVDSLYGGFQFAARGDSRKTVEAPAGAFWFVFPRVYTDTTARRILKECFSGWGDDCVVKNGGARYLEEIGAWPKPAFYIRSAAERAWPGVNNIVMDMRNYK